MPRAEQLIFQILQGISSGHLEVHSPDGSIHVFGDTKKEKLVLHVKNERVYREALRSESLGIGETYMAGDWEMEDDKICSCCSN